MNLFQQTRSGIKAGLAGLAALALAHAEPALAQQPAVQPPPLRPAVIAPGTQALLMRLQPGMTLDRYLENLRSDFVDLDADADGKLSQSDTELEAVMQNAQARGMAIMFVMHFDLDGDGMVTEDEIRRTLRYQMRTQLAWAAADAAKAPASPPEGSAKPFDDTVRSIMALDSDKDGKVSFLEAGKYLMPGVNRGLNGAGARLHQVLTLDAGAKGELTLADYQAAGGALFHKIDSDNDGTISRQELIDYRRQPNAPDVATVKAAAEAAQQRARELADAARKRVEAAQAEQAQCDMPAASEKAKVIVLSGYQTDALSSVTLGSQEAVVHAGRIVVEPGTDPLYVVITTYSPTIWQFSGAVERIERVVMTSALTGPNSGNVARPPLVGATGLAAERIHFFPKRNCLQYFTETPTGASLPTVAAIRHATGKEPDVVASKYSVSSFAVPSGKIETLRDGQQPLIIRKSQGTLNIVGNNRNIIIQSGPSRARDDLYRYFPGGVTDIDPKAVVGSVAATAYDVLPEQAGLVQLLASGALTQNGAGEYIVRQKIRFPAGLAGAHAVTFLVMKDTPYPDGDPGHSCVIMEDSGEKKGAACR